MSKQKVSIGVYQDGFTAKIARLSLHPNNIVKIEELLSCAVSDEKGEPIEESYFQTPQSSDVSDIDDTFDEDSFNIPVGDSSGEFEVLDEPETQEEKPEDSESLNLQKAAQQLKFCSGIVSTNLDISNVTYKDFAVDKKTTKKKIYQMMEDEFKEGSNGSLLTYSYFKNNEDKLVGVCYEGKMDLLESIIQINHNLGCRTFKYGFIQPNEIALVNALRLNFKLSPDSYSAIFYIGLDYSRVTLVKGNDFFLDLPIINEVYRSQETLKTVYSRYLLEKTQNMLPKIDHFFLAGENITASSLDFLAEKEPESDIRILLPYRLLEKPVTNSKKEPEILQEIVDHNKDFPEKQLAEYIIPITLAMLNLTSKNTDIVDLNFLPKILKEQQNFFAMDVKGFLALGLIVGAFVIGSNLYFSTKLENQNLKQQISLLNTQIAASKPSLENIEQLNHEIALMENKLQRVGNIVQEKNRWHERFMKLSRLFYYNQHTGYNPSVNWIDYFTSKPDGFSFIGKTTNRRHIILISNLFPGSVINFIRETEMFGYTVWEYEIDMKYNK